MKKWVSAPCAYCGSTIPFIKLADVMKVKCRKCSRLQTVSIPRVIEEPKVVEELELGVTHEEASGVVEEPEVVEKIKVKSKSKKKKKEDLYEVTTEYGMEA